MEHSGKPHVVVVSMEAYERPLLVQKEEDWRELVRQAREQVRANLGKRTLPLPVEVLRQTREERAEQLVAVN